MGWSVPRITSRVQHHGPLTETLKCGVFSGSPGNTPESTTKTFSSEQFVAKICEQHKGWPLKQSIGCHFWQQQSGSWDKFAPLICLIAQKIRDLYHLESRGRNSNVLPYHGPYFSQPLGSG